MAKRGRQSGAELSVIVDLSRAPPPPPPDDLPPSQAATWRNTVGCLPSGHVTKAAHPVLVQLCRHVDRSAMLEGMIATFKPEWCSSDEGLQRLDKLLQMAERESRATVACSRSLRLTPSSMVHPVTAARRMANHLELGGQKPWDPD